MSKFKRTQIKEGLVSMTIGAIPFYTTESNPRTISLNAGENQQVVFWVNATGGINTTHEFFAYANITTDMSIYAHHVVLREYALPQKKYPI